MKTATDTCRAIMHQIARWLDHPGGTCITKCGKTIVCGTSAKYVDTKSIPKCEWDSCPLCEAARIIDQLEGEQQ